MLESMALAASKLSEPMSILMLLLGTLLGASFGALPGLGAILSMAVALPFSYGMDPMHAMFMFAGVMSAGAFGGSVPAILLNTPGTAQNAATCLDGYPMAKNGEGGRAIAISATACFRSFSGRKLMRANSSPKARTWKSRMIRRNRRRWAAVSAVR